MAERDQGSTDGLRPLCFVLMPFGEKPDPTGGPPIDFDAVYNDAIKPGIEAAGLEPIRADEEATIGIIHRPMFERLLLADFAVADLTTANANVFYELGIRHTARPATTLTIFASHQPIPFDVRFLRSESYTLGPDNTFGKAQADELKTKIANRLRALRERAQETVPTDSPVFELLSEWKPGEIARLKTDTFRERVRFNKELKAEIADARSASGNAGLQKLKEIEDRISFDSVEAGILIDLMLSHRALSDWDGMIALYERFPEVVKRQVLPREQLAFALNRRAGMTDSSQDRDRALEVLQSVEEDQGPSSETCGLIGRVYKDLWAKSKDKDPIKAKGYLKHAVGAYLRGFQADWRDAYPGINAVTLLDIKGDDQSLKQKDAILPVVRFAVSQRLEANTPDYWDYATLLELAVLENKQEAASDHLADATAAIREKWEPETTANNLSMIVQARRERGEECDWLERIIANLKVYQK
jgi:hypothetical protein